MSNLPMISLSKLLLSRVRGEENGFSLVELLVAMSVGVIMILAVAAFADTGVQSQHNTGKLTGALNQQREGLERVTREIRQSTSFSLVNSQTVELVTWVHPALGSDAEERRVRYDCSSGEVCRRSVGPVGGSFTETDVEVVGVVQNADVFNPEPDLNPRYVAIALKVRARGTADSPDKVITLRDGVDLRNTAE